MCAGVMGGGNLQGQMGCESHLQVRTQGIPADHSEMVRVVSSDDVQFFLRNIKFSGVSVQSELLQDILDQLAAAS